MLYVEKKKKKEKRNKQEILSEIPVNLRINWKDDGVAAAPASWLGRSVLYQRFNRYILHN